MGLFDDFSELFAGISELGDELKGLKDDFISSVIEPGQELKDTVGDITSTVTGKVNDATNSATSAVQDLTNKIKIK